MLGNKDRRNRRHVWTDHRFHPYLVTAAVWLDGLAESHQRAMVIVGSTVAATATSLSNSRTIVIIWPPGGRRRTIVLTDRRERGTSQPISTILGGVTDTGHAIVTRIEPMDGAMIEEQFRVFDIDTQIDFGRRVAGESVHSGEVDRDSLAITVDDQGGIGQIDAVPGSISTYALIVRGSTTTALGAGAVLALRGRFAAGYRQYDEHGILADPNINVNEQHSIAVRWNGRNVQELGPGAAYAVAPDGVAVGTDGEHAFSRLPEVGRVSRSSFVTLGHAVRWRVRQRAEHLLETNDPSVAWDIASDGSIVGGRIAADGTHRAFRWYNGRATDLDRLVHALGWRFETAYAFGPDGAVAGTGTYKGRPSAFLLKLR